MKQVIKLVFLCAFMFIMGFQSFAIKPDSVYVLRPENLGLIYRDLNVTTSDGLKIKTWLYPAQPALSEKEINEAWNNLVKKPYKTIDKEPRPTIIIANGDAGNMSYQQVPFALNFKSKGHNVVTRDWRGIGESSEWEMDNNYLVYTEMLLDYDAVIKEVMRQEEVDTNRIAVFGWSTGAYLSMAASSKYDNIKAFVGIGLITSFDDVLPLLKQLQTHKDRNFIVPDDYPKELLPVNLAANY